MSAQPVVYVDASATGTGTGLSWSNAKTNLQDALALADGATYTQIWVAAGTYYPDIGSGFVNNDRTVSFTLKNNVEIYGGFDKTEVDPAGRSLACYGASGFTNSCTVPTDCLPQEVCVPDVITVLSGDLAQNDGPNFAFYGDNSFHVLTAPSTIGASAVLDGFQIRGGNANGAYPQSRGGALFADGGDPSIRKCRFQENRCGQAGGAFQGLSGAGPQFDSCLFEHNQSSGFGGAYASAQSPATLDYCVFRENSALTSNGGAMDNFEGSVVTQDSYFEANTSGASGGAVMNFGVGAPEFHRCIFRDNQADYGGAMYSYLCDPQITESSFVENNANADGGAAHFDQCPSATLIGLTCSGNQSNDDGGALRFIFAAGTVTDSLFENNYAGSTIDNFGGGAVSNLVSQTSFSNCDFYNNSAGNRGGAIMEEGNGVLEISDCEFANNESIIGGALSAAQGGPVDPPLTPVKINNSRFYSNKAESGGAAHVAEAYGSNWVNVEFLGNQAVDDGGAVDIVGVPANFTNCLFVSNMAQGVGVTGVPPLGGGAFIVQLPGGHAHLNNCTIVKNSTYGTHVSDNGGAILAVNTNTLTVANSIFWMNFATGAATTEESQIAYDNVGSISVQYSIIEGLDVFGLTPADMNLDLNPQFRAPSGADLTLAPGSPAIGWGSSGLLPTDVTDIDGDLNVAEPLPLDLNGFPRIDGTLDIGAYEYYSDCDYNGVPDACDVDCAALSGTCVQYAECGMVIDCDGNNIPDACDQKTCGGVAGCSDCQPNFVLDTCDIAGGEPDVSPADGVPDACTFSTAATTAWTDPALWDLGGQYPDNQASAAGLFPTVSGGATVDLDETVVINGLTVQNAAHLHVTKASGVPGDGDLIIAGSGNVAVHGDIFVANDRTVDVSGGTFTVYPGGTYAAAGGGGDSGCNPGEVCAALIAHDVAIIGGECGSNDFGGKIVLTSAMSLEAFGNVLLDGPLDPDCTGGTIASSMGVTRPPKLKILDSSFANLRADLILERAAELDMGDYVQAAGVARAAGTGGTINLEGNFINKATFPELVELRSGTINLVGSTPQTFEAASLDLGAFVPAGFSTDEDTLFDTASHGNFAIGNLNIAAGADVRFVNEYVNTAGRGACTETVYVDNLTLESGSIVRLDNVRVQYRTLTDNGATIELIGCGALVQPSFFSTPKKIAPDETTARGGRNLRINTSSGNVAGVVDEIIRVRIVSLDGFPVPSPDVLFVGPPYDAPEGDSSQPELTYRTAPLVCEPYSHPWNAEGVVAVYGAELIPNSEYVVQRAYPDCPDLSNELCWSEAVTITTGKFGDVTALFDGPSGPAQPDFTDISALVEKFLTTPGAPLKSVAQQQPNVVFPLRQVDFRDISAVVSAFLSTPYKLAIDAFGPCTCPSTVTCGTTACTGDTTCGDGFCIDGFCTDACGRCSP